MIKRTPESFVMTPYCNFWLTVKNCFFDLALIKRMRQIHYEVDVGRKKITLSCSSGFQWDRHLPIFKQSVKK